MMYLRSSVSGGGVLNRIWCLLILIAIVYGSATHEISSLNEVIINVGEETLEFAIPLMMATCFWNGMMCVAKEVGLLRAMERVIHPLLSRLFPDLKSNPEALQYIGANVIINMFGLGFAATPSGLKAMKLMQERNPDKKVATRSMVTFLVLNTAGVTLLATNIVTLRNQAGAQNPTDFLPYAICATVCASIAGLSLDRWWNYRKR